MKEQQVGVVTHYFGGAGVAGVTLSGKVSVGDTLRFHGHTTDFTQTLESMQIEHESVDKAKAKDEIGIKVGDRVRINDKVYKVEE
jgi:transcription antitermination factor NusG